MNSNIAFGYSPPMKDPSFKYCHSQGFTAALVMSVIVLVAVFLTLRVVKKIEKGILILMVSIAFYNMFTILICKIDPHIHSIIHHVAIDLLFLSVLYIAFLFITIGRDSKPTLQTPPLETTFSVPLDDRLNQQTTVTTNIPSQELCIQETVPSNVEPQSFLEEAITFAFFVIFSFILIIAIIIAINK